MYKIYCNYILLSVLILAPLISIVGVASPAENRLSGNPRTAIDPPSKFDKSFAVYAPIQLPVSGEVKDTLSDRDIPTGDGGFARDYTIKLAAGENIAIDLTSEVFDTVVILLNAEGKNIAKNDDGADGSSNSLLFTRIKNAGNYIIRVQGFGETSSGDFRLKVTKLKEK